MVQETIAVDLCRCGHPREAHEHFRRGLDCGSCGVDVCSRYARAERWGPMLIARVLRRRPRS